VADLTGLLKPPAPPTPPPEKDKLPANCGACTMHRHDKLICHRHAPSPGSQPLRIVKWPKMQMTDRCGAGSTKKKPVSCGSCVHHWRPDGKPLAPRTSGAHGSGIWDDLAPIHDKDWWQDSALCTAVGPRPGVDVHPILHHGVVNLKDGGCGDGRLPDDQPS
jgi:hypothetical protein